MKKIKIYIAFAISAITIALLVCSIPIIMFKFYVEKPKNSYTIEKTTYGRHMKEGTFLHNAKKTSRSILYNNKKCIEDKYVIIYDSVFASNTGIDSVVIKIINE